MRYAAHHTAQGVDVEALERTLRRRVRGEVRFDAGSRGAYSTDASNFRQPPLGVVVPLDADDLVATLASCRAHGAPVTHRGGGTSLAGQTTNVAVVVDSSKHLDRVVSVDPDRREVVAEPGVVLDALRAATTPYGLWFGPDPATHSRCTVGGMVGNNSCGTHSLTTGRTADNVVALDVLLYDGSPMTVRSSYDDAEVDAAVGREGEVLRALRSLRDRYADRIRARFPDIPRLVSGYGLDALLPENGFNVARALVGTEGTCVTVLRARLRLVPKPVARALVVLGYSGVAAAADDVPRILGHRPIALEGLDSRLLAYRQREGKAADAGLLPDGSDFLFVELAGATTEEAAERARTLARDLEADLGPGRCRVHTDEDSQQRAWQVREGALGLAAQPPAEPLMWAGWEDAAVPPERLGDYLRVFRRLLDGYGYGAASFYGHFGDGCTHTRIPFDLRTADGIAAYRSFLDDAADLVASYGGSLSGEHGDGQQRAALLGRMFGDDLVEAFREFKKVWDPDNRMNPGKVVDEVRVFAPDENLRLGTDYAPAEPSTRFVFPDGFARETLRCVGVGACRRQDGGTMCPSYQATREEEHSTRGRARLLFEMLDGEVVTGGWQSDAVHDALDLCLACKGCKRDCPVGVDMATYKAEFLSHYYEEHRRPRHAYAMGLVMYAARVGSRLPRLANAALHAPLVNRVSKRMAGVAGARRAPRLAHESFRTWFAARPSAAEAGREVLLFPDTFTNYFEPQVGRATTQVLEAAGFVVRIPPRVLCCGRPLFDYGMVDHARRLLSRVVATLRHDIRAGVPMVVPEPSCAAVFRDELRQLFPHDVDAQRLAAQTVTLAELLERAAPQWRPPRVDVPLLVQRHCQHSAVMGHDAERALLSRAGARFEMPPTGCCGLAGSWGYEREHFALSMQIGERALFPLVRDRDPATVVVADGFSCRSQLAQGTGVRAVSLAEVLAGHRTENVVLRGMQAMGSGSLRKRRLTGRSRGG